MPYDPTRHHRRSIRLAGFDYASPGWYFVTLCTHQRASLFGEIEAGAMHLSTAGRMVEDWWYRLPTRFPTVRLDAFVVMPNHVHGILGIADAPAVPTTGVVPPTDAVSPTVGAPLVGARPEAEPSRNRAGTRPAPTGLGDVVGTFKSLTTNAYIRGVRAEGWAPFDGRLWQRNYWERVIRDERELDLARRYIADNPMRWHFDRMNPVGDRRHS